jgi:hypothetical protein
VPFDRAHGWTQLTVPPFDGLRDAERESKRERSRKEQSRREGTPSFRRGVESVPPPFDRDGRLESTSTAVRGKYYRRIMREGANVAVLDPDVAKVFRNSAAVNEALRSLLRISETTRRLARSSSGRAARPRR